MSTWIYLVCLSHDPPLRADGESGQHLYDLDRTRAEIADREDLVRRYEDEEGWWRWRSSDAVESHFHHNTVAFLAQHPRCTVGIRDEYGTYHPIEPQET